MLNVILVSTGVVALAEFGDKTQLLALLLAARFRKPLPIIAGITVATLANHAVAAALGSWVSSMLGPTLLRWLLGLSFIAMAAWILRPDQLDEPLSAGSRRGAFVTTLIAFFLAEIGDKTQIATVALAARYQASIAVILGTTLGMLLANVPAVLAGDRLARHVSLRWMRSIAAALFGVLGLLTLAGAGQRFGF